MEITITTYALILALPLVAFVVQVFFGKRLPRGGDWLVIGAICIDLLLSLRVFFGALFFSSFAGTPFVWNLRGWLGDAGTGVLALSTGILVDNVTAMMLVVVTGCCTLIFLFSTGYMAGHRRYSLFFAYLSLFAFSMLLLVLGNNLIALFMGWELVGLSSYLLIGFLFEEPVVAPDIVPASACKKAFITNRIGDTGFLLGILTLFSFTGKIAYGDVFEAVRNGAFGDHATLLTVAGILLFCGAMAKSAQFPLHVWLPDAMAGPTPVSALIHAATMVAAGVYMVARLYPLFTPDALTFIAYVGAFTALFGATIALVMNDIKRVLAYSTISQLGYMVFGLGVGAYSAGLFHLMTHAFFKALLFLAAGSVIHAMHRAYHHAGLEWNPRSRENDAQDMRNMGGLRKAMPVTFATTAVAVLAISGVPFTSGFLSKDMILGGAFAFGFVENPQHFLIPVFGFAAALLTAFYMARLLIMTFLGTNRMAERGQEALRESPWNMTVPLVLLAVLCGWFWYNPDPTTIFAKGWVSSFLTPPASAVPQTLVAAPADAHHAAHVAAMLVSLFCAGAGFFAAWMLDRRGAISLEHWRLSGSRVYQLLANKYYVDELYNRTVVAGMVQVSRILGWFDKVLVDGVVNATGRFQTGLSELSGFVDRYGVDGLVNALAGFVRDTGNEVRQIQTGRIQNYVVYATVGLIVLIVVTGM
ncbi:MAG TPA: NADH-quinone oxidoreductase subunit L [Candidatus Latescibacteria bacterium]|nr:NADH-quinone oxidoreductase subunit L [Candidatus Latescibacterota bacterium]